MGMLGDFLPKVGSSISEIAGQADSAIQSGAKSVGNFISSGTSNFNLAGVTQKLSEGANKIIGGFGSALGFKNLAGGLPKGLTEKLPILGGGNSQTLKTEGNNGAARENLDDVIVMLQSTVDGEMVRFAVTPRISESRGASYHEINILHHPGSILKYEKTGNRSWSIGARLISRNQSEASINQYYLNVVRGWVMPYYGAGTEALAPEKLGAPPPVLKFSGYGARNISPIPVVLESYDTSWPNDVDYIPTHDGTPFPVIMEINLNLKEAYSPGEYSKFDLYAYKTGDLTTAYGGTAAKTKKPSASTANGITDTSSPINIGKLAAAAGVPSAASLGGLGSSIGDIAKGVTGGVTSGGSGAMTIKQMEDEARAKIRSETAAEHAYLDKSLNDQSIKTIV